jgi:hypothetical protein
MLEHLSDTLIRLCRALEILQGTDLLADILSLIGVLALSRDHELIGDTDLLGGDWLLRGLVQLLNRLLVVSEILLATYKDDGKALAEVQDLGDPLR